MLLSIIIYIDYLLMFLYVLVKKTGFLVSACWNSIWISSPYSCAMYMWVILFIYTFLCMSCFISTNVIPYNYPYHLVTISIPSNYIFFRTFLCTWNKCSKLLYKVY